jgi:hypothetical protein
MPAKQRGTVVKRGKRWQARYRDEQGNQRGQGGFMSKTPAADWLEQRAKEVLALRRGERIPVTHRRRRSMSCSTPSSTATAEPSTRRRNGSSLGS